MLAYPFISLFLLTLVSSTLIALSSFHWTIVWVALELNIISFIPLISSSGWLQESEAALNYLLFQAVGSSILLLGGINQLITTSILLGLSLNLGIAPFHFWFPSVIKSIPWPTAALLATWQNLAPIIILISSLHQDKPLALFIGLTSAIAGAIGGFGQAHLRPLLAYSSIGHIGWMVSVSTYSPSVGLLYLISYIIISAPIIWSAFLANVQNINTGGITSNTPHSNILLSTTLSLSGLPPLMGFIPNLLALQAFSTLLCPVILILSSLINLSYYLNFFFSAFMPPVASKTIYSGPPLPQSLSLISWLATSPVPFIFVLLALL